jgi:hypothetical protein
MELKRLLNQIEEAGAWLPLTTVRQAFGQCEAIIPALLTAIQQRAETAHSTDIRQHRLATFGVFYLAQHREPRLFAPLIRLLETTNPDQQDEWLFAGRLFFFGHRLLAGVCPFNAQQLVDLAMDPTLSSMTRAAALIVTDPIDDMLTGALT